MGTAQSYIKGKGQNKWLSCASVSLTPWSIGLVIPKKGKWGGEMGQGSVLCSALPTTMSILLWLLELSLTTTSFACAAMLAQEAHNWKEQAQLNGNWVAYSPAASSTGYKLWSSKGALGDVQRWSTFLALSLSAKLFLSWLFFFLNLSLFSHDCRYKQVGYAFNPRSKPAGDLPKDRDLKGTLLVGAFFEQVVFALVTLCIFFMHWVDNFSQMADQGCELHGFQIPANDLAEVDGGLQEGWGACTMTPDNELYNTNGTCIFGSITQQVDWGPMHDQSGLVRNPAALFAYCGMFFVGALLVRWFRNSVLLCIGKSGGDEVTGIVGRTLDNLPTSVEEELTLIRGPNSSTIEETTYGLSGLSRVDF